MFTLCQYNLSFNLIFEYLEIDYSTLGNDELVNDQFITINDINFINGKDISIVVEDIDIFKSGLKEVINEIDNNLTGGISVEINTNQITQISL